MTTEARPTLAPPSKLDEPPPQAPPPPEPKNSEKEPDRPRIAIGVAVLVVVVAAYALSLLGVHLLEKSEGPLPPLDLSQGGGDATIVQLRLEELKPVANRLSVNVLVYPGV